MTIVGRDAVLRRLAGAARGGPGGLVVLRAYPGGGVSAVLAAHAAAMRVAGLATYWVRAVPPDGRTVLSGGPPDWTGPGVVVVDRTDLVDDATVLTLHQLLDDRRALSVVCDRRRGTVPPRLTRQDEVLLDLAPLDDAAVRRMADGVPVRRRPLVRGAGGNPRLVTLLAEPDRARAITGWVSSVVGDDLRLLRFAALLARPVSVAELAVVSRLAPAAVVGAVDRLCALGFLDEAADRITLRHDVVRDALAEVSSGLCGPAARALAESGAPPARVVAPLAGATVTAWAVDWLDRHADLLCGRPTTGVVVVLRAAADWLPRGDDRAARLRTALAEALLGTGDLDAATHAARTSLAARPPPPLRHRLRAVLAQAHIARMDAEGAIAALDPERDAGRLPGRLGVLDAYARLLAGDLAGTTRAVEAATPEADDPRVEVGLLHLRAAACCLARDLTGAERLLDRAAALLAVAVIDLAQWVLSGLLRVALKDLRHDTTALDTAEEVRAAAHQLGAGWLAWWRTVAALAAYNAGRWEQALTEVEVALAEGDQYGMARPLHGIAALILAHQGELAAAQGHVARAGRLGAPGVAAFYEQVPLSAQAMIADLAGEPEPALEIARVVPGGDVHATHSRAFDRYSTLSATTDSTQTTPAPRLRDVRVGARKRPKQGWDSLTEAERRVADLVAQGRTNREIATHLVVSVRTVDSHVSRILTKLGYTSRASIIRGQPPGR